MRDGAGTHYDALGRPVQWLHKNRTAGTVLIGFAYAYDRAGNRLMQRSIHDPLDSQRYSYDSASRLVSASRGEFGEGDFVTSPSLYCESPTTATWTTEESAFQWGLDGAGNWDQYDTWKNAVETNQTRTDTNFNEIHQVAATTLTHNDHGDMTYDGTHQYKWDAFGRLREVRSAGGTLQATYYYDADHRRVRKDYPSGTDLDFLYDGWRAIEIRNAASQWPFFQSIFGNHLDEQLEADYNAGTPDATCTGAGDAAYGIQNNALFSVYAVTRPDKSINSAFEYDPYGYPTRLIDGNDGDTTVNFNSNDTRAAGIGSTFLHSFTGQIFDPESGLYHYKRRYYHPALGRFISRDPLRYRDGAALYIYARSSPFVNRDPSGLVSCGHTVTLVPPGSLYTEIQGPEGTIRIPVQGETDFDSYHNARVESSQLKIGICYIEREIAECSAITRIDADQQDYVGANGVSIWQHELEHFYIHERYFNRIIDKIDSYVGRTSCCECVNAVYAYLGFYVNYITALGNLENAEIERRDYEDNAAIVAEYFVRLRTLQVQLTQPRMENAYNAAVAECPSGFLGAME